MEPPNGDPDMTAGETVEAETPDRLPITEPAEERGGIIEAGTAEALEHPGENSQGH